MGQGLRRNCPAQAGKSTQLGRGEGSGHLHRIMPGPKGVQGYLDTRLKQEEGTFSSDESNFIPTSPN